MASLGLPGMSGFISEFMVFIGSYQSIEIPTWIVVVSVFGVILTAAYILRMIQKMFLGQFNTKWESLTEINGREIFTVVPLAVLTLLVGILPNTLNQFFSATVDNLVKIILSK
jgi:NADH-quinone oxidoreductase subunit M